jgi:D-beta-D-heptose 7-phosphate kinase/D-beta-D-heptose 1-phosphate adenosyltransferase
VSQSNNFRHLNLISPEDKILNFQQAIAKIKELKERKLRVALASGVFDVFHRGHVEYLRQAWEAADVVFVGVEKDSAVKLNKGSTRPICLFEDRVRVLSAIVFVDYVFGMKSDIKYSDVEAYIERLRQLNPTGVVVCKWDENFKNKKYQAEQVGIELIEVSIPRIDSSTRIIEQLGFP